MKPRGKASRLVPTSTSDDPELPGGTWPWAIAAAVLMLLAFPLARWTKRAEPPVLPPEGHRTEVAATLSPAAEALQASLEHYQAGRYEDAVSSAKAALKSDPGLAAAYNILAVSYLKLSLLADAERAANEAIRLSPDDQLAKSTLGWIELEKAKASRRGAPR